MSEAMLLACDFWYLNAYRISRRSLFRGETSLLAIKAWTLFKEPHKYQSMATIWTKGGRTFKSAPTLVARPCSTSPSSNSLSLSTRRLSSPTSATCLLTFPPSFLNSGYSSTNCFISEIEFIEDGCCARERAWYDWTYDLSAVPRSPKVAR
jgi:hypothetical protein